MRLLRSLKRSPTGFSDHEQVEPEPSGAEAAIEELGRILRLSESVGRKMRPNGSLLFASSSTRYEILLPALSDRM
jgi:hypothetical protein